MPFQLEPTFPLDARAIQARVRVAKMTDPLSWGIAAGTLLLGVAGGSLGFAVMVPLGMAALWHHWKKIHKRVEASVIDGMISESNRNQDARLNERIRSLRNDGHYPYASALGRFLLLKQRVEDNLHKDQQLTLSDRKMDNAVDEITELACNHFDRLIEIDEKVADALTSQNRDAISNLEQERTRILLQIQQAYGSVYRSLNTLISSENHLTRLVPAQNAPAPRPTREAMARAIRNLEDEAKLIQDAHRQVEEDLTR